VSRQDAGPATPEAGDARLKRLAMRSWRRGTKEMDMILGPFADARLAGLPVARLALYDRLLGENDHDLYAWIIGTLPMPAPYAPLLTEIAGFALGRHPAASPGTH
jgi:antitoxin CptB